MEVGFVRSVKDFLIYLDGLPTIRLNDLVENEQGLRGWVNSLLPNLVEVLLLDEGYIQPGQMFKRTGQKLTVPVGQFLLGRSINPLGIPIDGKGLLAKTKQNEQYELERAVRGIADREFITEQLLTGITIIDSIIPIGRGQRELIMGDPRSGKTDFLIDTIINQKQTGVVCVVASIGKPVGEVRNLIDTLEVNNALSHTVVIAASSSDPAPLIFLTPQTAFAVADYFQRQGQHVLVILDDIGNHAKIHREISLLSDRSPGRESYPGDIFYQHAHLLERAGNYKKEAGGGSITALPFIELNINDFTTLIPTNLMGMTDGHILFKSGLYLQGQRPAADISLSVTRVGQQTQNKIQNQILTKIKQTLAQAAQLETVSRFSSELPFATQLILLQKEQITELIKQQALTYIPPQIQTILLSLPYLSFFHDKDRTFIGQYKDKIVELFSKDPVLSQICQNAFALTDANALIAKLEEASPRLSQLLAIPLPKPTSVKSTQPVAPPTPLEPGKTSKKDNILGKVKNVLKKKKGEK